VPPAKGIVKTAFSLRYQDIAVGTGAEAQFIKSETVHYTGWTAVDGHKFDSSYERRDPVMGKDGKPVMDEGGKPKLGDPHPVPFNFVEGNPRLIPGWNLGIDGMKVGGKRRIFIPWQLAYGVQGRPGPDPAHPLIPPKADLIFDIELLDVKDMQMPANHPGMGAVPPNGHPVPGGTPPAPPAAGTPAPGTPVQPGASAAPAPPAPSAAPATPAPPAPPATPAPAQPQPQ
jgi:peptidylprolyl isomerase